MAAVKDTYTLELLDKILAPLKRIEAQAEKVGGVMERLEKMAGSGLGLAKLAGAVGGAVVGLGLLGKALGGVYDLFEKAAHVAWEFGKSVVEAARFAQASKLSFDIFLGKGQGEGVFNRTLRAGNLLPIDERDLVRNAQALAGAGYSGHRLDAANAALSDIEALRGKFYSQNLLLHLQRLQNEARPQARDVNMAAIDAGTGLGGIYKQLYKQQGMAMPKDPDSEEGLHTMTKQYELWVKQGRIGGKSVADAIMAAIEERFDEGKGLGTAAIKLGMGTLGGILSNLEAAPQRFLMQLGVEKMAGVRTLLDFLKKILEYFNLATPQGQQLAKVTERLVNSLFGGLGRIGERDLEHWFEGGVKVAEQFVHLVEKAWGVLDEILHGSWSSVLGAAAGVISGLGRLLGVGLWQGMRASLAGSSPILAKMVGFDVSAMKDLKDQEGGLKRRLADNPNDVGAASQLAEVQRIISGLDTSHTHIPGRRDGTWHDDLGNTRASFGQAIDAAGTAFLAAWHSAGADFARAFSSGQGEAPKEAGRNIVAGAVDGMNDEGKMHSPSRVTYEQGRNLVQGFIDGVRDKMAELEPGGEEDFHDQLLGALRAMVARGGGAPA
jgi:hypothetical protein